MSNPSEQAEMEALNQTQVTRQEVVYVKPDLELTVDLDSANTTPNRPEEAVAAETSKVEPVDESDDEDVKFVGVVSPPHLDICRMIYNTKQLRFQCTQCEYRSRAKGKVAKHMRYHDEVACWDQYLQESSGEVAEPQPPMVCHKCSYRTTHSSAFQQHLMLHMERKVYGCTNCKFKAYTEGGLKRHLVLHTKRGDKSRGMLVMPKVKGEVDVLGGYKEQVLRLLYRCGKCEYETRNKYDLKLHVAAHLLAEPYACTECKFLTADAGVLRRHVADHTKATQEAFKTDLKARWGSVMKLRNNSSNVRENVD